MTAEFSDSVRDQRDYPKDLVTSVAHKLEAANVIDVFGALFIMCVIIRTGSECFRTRLKCLIIGSWLGHRHGPLICQGPTVEFATCRFR